MLPDGVLLIRMRLEHDRQRAAERAATPHQEPLPWGDGWLDDDTPEYHGTNVGLARHSEADQELCWLCRRWIEELIGSGFARRLEDA